MSNSKEFLKDTLMDLLNIESFSGNEQPVIEYLFPILLEFGFKVEIDAAFNIYAVRGDGPYVLLNAHMDSVEGSKWSKKSYTYNDVCECFTCKKCSKIKSYKPYPNSSFTRYNVQCETYGLVTATNYDEDCPYYDGPEKKSSEEEEEQEVFELKYEEKTKKITSNKTRPMGGDDKCGIAIALDIARTTEIPMKILFTTEEETGCNGATFAAKNHADWFEDILYGLTIDRRGGNHICVTTGSERNGSNYFIAELAKWAIISGINPSLEKGSMSDNFTLKYLVQNFVNVSAGYYEAHRNSEYIKFDEVKRIKTWLKNFILKGDFEC